MSNNLLVEKVTIPERTALRITCPKCSYCWVYGGTKGDSFVICPGCHSTITMHPRRKNNTKTASK
jgi:hypothetical protein